MLWTLRLRDRLTVGATDAELVLWFATGDASEGPLHYKCRDLVLLLPVFVHHFSPGKHCHDVCHATIRYPNLKTEYQNPSACYLSVVQLGWVGMG